MREGVCWEVIDGKGWLFRVNGREFVWIGMIDGSVFFQEFGRAVTHVMRMGKAEVDEEGGFGLCFFPFFEVFEHSLAMPCATALGGAAALGGIMNSGEFLISFPITVALFAGAHGVVAGFIEGRGHDVLENVFRRSIGPRPNR